MEAAEVRPTEATGRQISPEVVLWSAVVQQIFTDAFEASDNILADSNNRRSTKDSDFEAENSAWPQEQRHILKRANGIRKMRQHVTMIDHVEFCSIEPVVFEARFKNWYAENFTDTAAAVRVHVQAGNVISFALSRQ